LVKWLVKLAYTPWRSPRTQAILLILLLIATLIWAYFRVANDAETHLAVLGAGLAATIAIWGVVNQWAISRRQLTIQFIRDLETDKEYAEALALFNAAANSGNIKSYALSPPKSPKVYKEWVKTEAAIALILNQQEIIAIGVGNSILDYRLLCAWFRTSYIKRYDRAKPYIDEIRTQTSTVTLFVEFERFAGRLKRDEVHVLT